MQHDAGVTTYLLVPSPLLGAATWQPVASHLRHRGRAAVVVDLGDARTPDDVVAASADAARGLEDLVLVPHSNAGYVTPHLAERLDARASVHVDAALPSATGSRTPLAPAGLLDRLRALADDDGVLPAWSDWWTPEDLAAVLPDDDVWAPVASAQPRLPLDYFTAEVAVPAGLGGAAERLPRVRRHVRRRGGAGPRARVAGDQARRPAPAPAARARRGGRRRRRALPGLRRHGLSARIRSSSVAAVVAAHAHLDDLDAAVGRGQRLLELGQRPDPQCGVRVAAQRLARSTPCGVPKSRS